MGLPLAIAFLIGGLAFWLTDVLLWLAGEKDRS
jgi:hypothetical protein